MPIAVKKLINNGDVLFVVGNNDILVNSIQRFSNVIIQKSIKEGFCLAVTEALWKGKPVISSNLGGIPFQIKRGQTGYFYRNPQTTAQKIIYLLDNPQVADRIGRKGQRYVQEHFLIVDRITDYLMSIIITMSTKAAQAKLTESVTGFYPW